MPSRGDPRIRIFDGGFLFERNHDAVARLAADHSSDVAMTGGIVREHNIARPETSHRTVAGFDLDLSGECDDILATRRRVIIAPMGWRHAPKEHPMCRLKLGNFHMSTEVEFNVDFFEVRFIVRAGVKSNDLHLTGFRGIDGKKQGATTTEPVPIVPAVPFVPKVQLEFTNRI
jgi:hypothetical protein